MQIARRRKWPLATRWTRVRPLAEGSLGVAALATGAVLLAGKAQLVVTAGVAAISPGGLVANLVLAFGGAMFLREARRHRNDR